MPKCAKITRLREEFETNCGVDGDVSAYAEADECSEDKNAVVIIRRSQAETESRGDEDCEIEGILSTCCAYQHLST